MAPKKPPAGKAAKDSGKEASGRAEGDGGAEEGAVSERESRLHAEYERLMCEQDGMRRRLEALRRENEFLQEEAERLRRESQDSLLYLGRRSQRRHDAIISLNDQNTREMEDLRRQKEAAEAALRTEEERLRDQLIQREAELASLRSELRQLEAMKEVQKEQSLHIRSLEAEVMASRGQHADSLLRVKSAFLRQQVQCQSDCERKLTQLSLKVHEEAQSALREVSLRTEEENRRLRRDLLQLIQRFRDLQSLKKRLSAQNTALRTEEQCQREVRGAQHRPRPYVSHD